MLWQDPSTQFWVIWVERRIITSTKIVCIWFSFVLSWNKTAVSATAETSEAECFKCSLNFLGKRQTIDVYVKKAGFNSDMSICWTKECRPCAMDALRTVLCMCIKATALILQTFSGIFFPLLYTEKLSAERRDLSFSIFFSVLQLPVTFSHPALNSRSWLTASCSFSSTSSSGPSLILDNKLGATVPETWETSLVDDWVFWVYQ